jgi:hypothetical protein
MITLLAVATLSSPLLFGSLLGDPTLTGARSDPVPADEKVRWA